MTKDVKIVILDDQINTGKSLRHHFNKIFLPKQFSIEIELSCTPVFFEEKIMDIALFQTEFNLHSKKIESLSGNIILITDLQMNLNSTITKLMEKRINSELKKLGIANPLDNETFQTFIGGIYYATLCLNNPKIQNLSIFIISKASPEEKDIITSALTQMTHLDKLGSTYIKELPGYFKGLVKEDDITNAINDSVLFYVHWNSRSDPLLILSMLAEGIKDEDIEAFVDEVPTTTDISKSTNPVVKFLKGVSVEYIKDPQKLQDLVDLIKNSYLSVSGS